MGCIGVWKAARPPEGGPTEVVGPFGLESAIGFDTPSDTNARRPNQKAGEVWSRDRNPSHFTLDLVSDGSANKRATLVKGIIRYYVATAAASVYLHFYSLSTTRVLNSFKVLCIMRAAAGISFARVLNPHMPVWVQSCIFRYSVLGCRIHRLHHSRGVRLSTPQWVSWILH